MRCMEGVGMQFLMRCDIGALPSQPGRASGGLLAPNCREESRVSHGSRAATHSLAGTEGTRAHDKAVGETMTVSG